MSWQWLAPCLCILFVCPQSGRIGGFVAGEWVTCAIQLRISPEDRHVPSVWFAKAMSFLRSTPETGYGMISLLASTSSTITFEWLDPAAFKGYKRRTWDWSLSAPWAKSRFNGHSTLPGWYGQSYWHGWFRGTPWKLPYIAPIFADFAMGSTLHFCRFRRAASQVCRLLGGAWLLVRASSGDPGIQWRRDPDFSISTLLSPRVGGYSRNNVYFFNIDICLHWIHTPSAV